MGGMMRVDFCDDDGSPVVTEWCDGSRTRRDASTGRIVIELLTTPRDGAICGRSVAIEEDDGSNPVDLVSGETWFVPSRRRWRHPDHDRWFNFLVVTEHAESNGVA